MGSGGGGGGGFLGDVLKPVLDPVMGAIGLKPDMPKAPSISAPPSPTSENPEAKKKAEDAMKMAADAERKARGRSSTILGGASDSEDPSLSGKSAKRTLLGG